MSSLDNYLKLKNTRFDEVKEELLELTSCYSTKELNESVADELMNVISSHYGIQIEKKIEDEYELLYYPKFFSISMECEFRVSLFRGAGFYFDSYNSFVHSAVCFLRACSQYSVLEKQKLLEDIQSTIEKYHPSVAQHIVGMVNEIPSFYEISLGKTGTDEHIYVELDENKETLFVRASKSSEPVFILFPELFNGQKQAKTRATARIEKIFNLNDYNNDVSGLLMLIIKELGNIKFSF